MVAFTFPDVVVCGVAVVPSWQDVAGCRTRPGRGKAEKVGAVASRQADKMPI